MKTQQTSLRKKEKEWLNGSLKEKSEERDDGFLHVKLHTEQKGGTQIKADREKKRRQRGSSTGRSYISVLTVFVTCLLRPADTHIGRLTHILKDNISRGKDK